MQSSSPPDAADAKATFRKPSNDAGNRKYRRRSPVNGSSSSDGSPKHDLRCSPIFSKEDPSKASEHRQRKNDDERELDRDPDRSQYGRGGDSYRHSDKHSFRSSRGYSRHDDNSRHDKHANDEDRNYHRLSSRSGRDSRTSTHSNYTRQESDYSRSKDRLSSTDKSIHDKYDITEHRSKDMEKESSYLERQKYRDKDPSSDKTGSSRRHTSSNSEETDRDWHKWDRDGRDEKRDYHRSTGDYRNDSSFGRDHGRHRLKEAYKSDSRELAGQKLSREEKKKYDDREINRDKDRSHRVDKVDFASENQGVPTKKQKFSNWDKGADDMKDAAEKMFSSSKQAQESGGSMALVQAHVSDSDINDLDAAKFAAMRAAELVNKNLVGGGYMSTEQKKKLLWGNKKSTIADESGHRWDTALFGDRDRQEKFNKLMSLSLPWYIWPIVGCEGRGEGRTQIRESRWQRSPPSREAEGTPAGFGKAVHSWTTTERWPHSRVGSLSIKWESLLTLRTTLCDILLDSCSSILTLVFLYRQLVRELIFCWAFQILGIEKCHLEIDGVQFLNELLFIVRKFEYGPYFLSISQKIQLCWYLYLVKLKIWGCLF